MFKKESVVKAKVVCIHIGARAHYLIPKAIQSAGQLHTLITDTWVASAWLRSFFSSVPVRTVRSLAGRYSGQIPSDKVRSFGFKFLLYETWLRLKYVYSWEQVIKRDQKFETEAVQRMAGIQEATSVLGISYTALECFTHAKQKGWKTILFQIDPGIEEEHIVASLLTEYKTETDWKPAPDLYWQRWKQECTLADCIMVNSVWSKTGLTNQGIPAEKIQVIPLPYALQQRHTTFFRSYPAAFTAERPLRCLFLGTLAVRKGIHLVLSAAKELYGLPIEFMLVGRPEISVSEIEQENIRYQGLVTREETDMYYQQADVFLFPTFSDGFGLTQLESMAWQLPVIATKKCGDVVQHAHNGWLMETVTAEELVTFLKNLLSDPDQIKACSENCLSTVKKFSEETFTAGMAAIL